MDFLWPIDPAYRWISGYTFNPPTHDAEDYGTPNNANFRAMQYGTVKRLRRSIAANNNDSRLGYGNFIEVDYGNGWVVLAAHLLDVLVEVGDKVTPGQVIAHCDHTGWSSGPHLHLRISHYGVPVKPSSVMKEIIMPPEPPVPPEPPASWVLPEFPTLPQGIVVVDSLMVRKKPDRSAITTHISLKRNQAVLAYDSYTDAVGNIWVCIGLDQWICGLYEGRIFVQF